MPAIVRRRQGQRRLLSSSSNAASSGTDTAMPFRVSRLGLMPSWISPALPTLQQLPELEQAVRFLQAKAQPTATLSSDLERSIQVLASVGKTEHFASLALTAEVQQRLGNHAKAYETVCQLLEDTTDNNNINKRMDLLLAQAKTAWYNGDFETTERVCYDLSQDDNNDSSGLHYSAALSGYGLGKLLAGQDLDDAYTIRDPTRMALKFLEANHPSPLALGAAHLNMGTAELIYGRIVGGERKVKVPVDPALRMWSDGLTLLERCNPRTATDKAIFDALKMRLHTNMAWGILQIDDGMDDIVPEASEQARQALACSDQQTDLSNEDKEFLKRILTVLATCYHKAGKAVTAEGLFQSATTLPSTPRCTLTTLDQKSAYGRYAALCRDWDKRQGDAERLEANVKEIDQTLPQQWQGKSAVCSSLWFWTPGEFQY